MLQIGIIVLCAVFVVGYIFFSVSSEQEATPGKAAHKARAAKDGSGKDAA